MRFEMWIPGPGSWILGSGITGHQVTRTGIFFLLRLMTALYANLSGFGLAPRTKVIFSILFGFLVYYYFIWKEEQPKLQLSPLLFL